MSVDKPTQKSWRQQTRMVRGGQRRSNFGETSEAMFLTSGFVYEEAAQAEAAFKNQNDRYIYSRFSNPTVEMFAERLRLAEGAEACRTTATGMAAVFASMACQVRTGDRVVASRALFGSCLFVLTEILPRWGVETIIVDGTDMAQWKAAFAKPTRTVFIETPSNPGLEIIDIRTRWLARRGKSDRSALRAFHDAITSAGMLPTSLAEKAIAT